MPKRFDCLQCVGAPRAQVGQELLDRDRIAFNRKASQDVLLEHAAAFQVFVE